MSQANDNKPYSEVCIYKDGVTIIDSSDIMLGGIQVVGADGRITKEAANTGWQENLDGVETSRKALEAYWRGEVYLPPMLTRFMTKIRWLISRLSN